MVIVVYNDQLVYKLVIWVFFGISLWKVKVALRPNYNNRHSIDILITSIWLTGQLFCSLLLRIFLIELNNNHILKGILSFHLLMLRCLYFVLIDGNSTVMWIMLLFRVLATIVFSPSGWNAVNNWSNGTENCSKDQF